MKGKLTFPLILCIAAAALSAPVAAQPPGPAVILAGPRIGWGWYDPIWAPYPYGVYVVGNGARTTGTLKLHTDATDAELLINGAYAGTVGKSKTIRLRPGSYDIELRAPGGRQYAAKIYVLAGKTLHLRPDLRVPE